MNGQTLISGGAIPNIPGSSYRAIGVADFNGDGKPDIFFRNSDSTLAVWQLNGTTLLQGGAVHSFGADSPTDGQMWDDDGSLNDVIAKNLADKQLLSSQADDAANQGGAGDLSLLTNYMASMFSDLGMSADGFDTSALALDSTSRQTSLTSPLS